MGGGLDIYSSWARDLCVSFLPGGHRTADSQTCLPLAGDDRGGR